MYVFSVQLRWVPLLAKQGEWFNITGYDACYSNECKIYSTIFGLVVGTEITTGNMLKCFITVE